MLQDAQREKLYKFFFFLSTGPFLIGWVIGVFLYNPNDTKFKLALQNAVLFFVHAFLLLFLYVLHALFTINLGVLYWIHSTMAFTYVIGTLVVFILSFFYNKTVIYPLVDSLLDNVILNHIKDENRAHSSVG